MLASTVLAVTLRVAGPVITDVRPHAIDTPEQQVSTRCAPERYIWTGCTDTREVGTKRSIGLGALATASVILTLLAAPSLLIVVDKIYQVDWSMLTDVGGSYAGVSALLSAAALVGVVVTVTLQARQNRSVQSQAARDMQFRLVMLALQD